MVNLGSTGLLKGRSKQWTQYFAAVAASSGAFEAGTWISWTSSAYDPIVNNQSQGFPVTESEFDLVGAIMPGGGILATFVLVAIMNKIGRKWTILGLAIPYIVGWLLVMYASNIYMMYLGRFIGGFSAGSFCLAAPLYVREIAEKNIRGRLSSFYTLMFVAGIFYCYVVGAFVSLPTLSYSCMALTFIFVALLAFQPESPVFYVMKNDMAQARKSLQYFRGPSYDIQPELHLMIERERRRKTSPVSFAKLFSGPSRKAMVICLALQLFQQVTGIEGILFYQKNIFDQSNVPISSDLATIITGGIHLVFTFVSSTYVDNLGRKFLLITSGSVIALCCAVLSFYYAFEATMSMNFSLIPVVSLCVFRAVYALGYGPMPWVIMAEVLSEEMKSSAAPLTGMFGNFLAAATTLYFNKFIACLGLSWTFLSFALASLVGVCFVMLYVPETKKRSLDEIQRILEGRRMSGLVK